MQTVYLRERLTHKYVDSYRHLDNHVHLGTVVLGQSRMVREADDIDDGGTYVRLAMLPAGLSRSQRAKWREVLAENLSKHGCAHEYDCCGCQSRTVRVHATNHARRAVVVTSIGYNF